MNNTKKTAIVIGAGAGGATMAKELQGKYQVTILEEGSRFRPFSYSVPRLARFRRTGIYRDERMIQFLLPSMVIDKTKDMVLVRGRGIGGTTTLATGNAVRYDGALRELGIDLDREFEELEQELPITTDHRRHWTETTERMFTIFEEMGLDPVVTPKLLDPDRCTGCGHCAIGCPCGAKWDTRALIEEAVLKGADIVTGCRVTDLTISGDSVSSVNARVGSLNQSGISCSETLFVDPVLCVAGVLPGIRQDRQLLMPFISQQDGYILSPYMDYLSFFFHKSWRHPIGGLVSMMIKLADEETGSVRMKRNGKLRVDKEMTPLDKTHILPAIDQCREILVRLGVPAADQFFGALNAGHPGGMLPLTSAEKDSLHSSRLPANLYVADTTILPGSMGNPPILTTMALAKKIAGIV